MDDIFSRLLNLTSYISTQFVQFVEDFLRDVSRCLEHIVTTAGGLPLNFFSEFDFRSVAGSSSTYASPSTSLGSHSGRDFDSGNEFPLNSTLQIVKNSYSNGSGNFILKGLMLPVFCLRLPWSLTLASLRCFLCYLRCAETRVKSIITRVGKTLHGSSDDIGWLQQAPGMPSVVDGSPRFLELLQDMRNGQHRLPDDFVYLLIPGLFSNHGPLYFVSTKRFFSKMGLACHIAKIHSEASVEQNAWELKQYIEELYWGSGKLVMLLGHSKGGVDAAAALSIYSNDLKDKVAGLVFVQSPYGGTPIASDILREGQVADKETRRIMEFLICKLIKGDIRALEDLTYDKRKEFISHHKIPENIPLISFHSEASIAPGVIATMTQIAHAELPWLPYFGLDEENADVQAGCKVPVILPISAAMAICALHLQLRYGEKSDGLVTCRDAEVPGSVVVKPDKKLDHGWMVYSSWKKDPTEPDACEMCEALLTMLVELRNQKSKEVEELNSRSSK